MKTCFKQVGYSFLVESTMIENASFPYKTAISEANVKTNKMVTTKCTYHKERSFSSNYFIFFENSVSVFVSARVSFYGAFSLYA